MFQALGNRTVKGLDLRQQLLGALLAHLPRRKLHHATSCISNSTMIESRRNTVGVFCPGIAIA
jgi:hypothetical protein